MIKQFSARSPWTFTLGLTMGLLVAVGVAAGMFLGQSQQAPASPLDELLLRASASSGGSSVSLATGPVSDDADGIFVLDHLTGDLQCWVLNTRRRQGTGSPFNAVYRYNVIRDLGIEQGKKPDYVMTVGSANFRASSMGSAVVYVADGNTGNVGCYGLPFDRSAASANRSQAFPLLNLGIGRARMVNIETDDE